jgi:hypothetical protein
MAPPKIVTGARAKVEITSDDGRKVTVGIFTSISYGVAYDATPVYTLGAYAPRDIEYTAQEPVSISASGWRIIDQGPHVQALFPTLAEILTHEYLQFVITDRQNPDKVIAKISNVRPTSYQTPIASRQLTEQSFSFMGILCSDETADNDLSEDGTASRLP